MPDDLKIANVKIKEASIEILGPVDLTTSIDIIIVSESDPEKRIKACKELYEKWFVECSITGELFPLSELNYWNVTKNEIYRDADVALLQYHVQ